LQGQPDHLPADRDHLRCRVSGHGRRARGSPV